jgi:hypothetical protein
LYSIGLHIKKLIAIGLDLRSPQGGQPRWFICSVEEISGLYIFGLYNMVHGRMYDLFHALSIYGPINLLHDSNTLLVSALYWNSQKQFLMHEMFSTQCPDLP